MASAFSKMKKKAKDDAKAEDLLHEARLERCVPVAKAIVKFVGESAEAYAFGDAAQESDSTETLAKKIIELMVEADIKFSDREFIMQLAKQPLDFAKEAVDRGFGRSWQITLTGLFGKPVTDVTITEIDALMKKGFKADPETEEKEVDKA